MSDARLPDQTPEPAEEGETGGDGPLVCALCLRPVLPGTPQSLHHLIPKLRGGKGGPTVLMHQICHNEIHATASEAELARLWNTPDKLREHPRLAKFVAWVRKRPADFHSKTPGARRGWKKR